MDDLDIGSVLQASRGEKKISLRQLAERTGLTASMLSQIERNLVTPSINTLKVIAAALEIPMYKFFMGGGADKNLVVRRDARITLGRPEAEDIVYELLTANVSGSIEFCMMHIPAKNGSTMWSPSTRARKSHMWRRGRLQSIATAPHMNWRRATAC